MAPRDSKPWGSATQLGQQKKTFTVTIPQGGMCLESVGERIDRCPDELSMYLGWAFNGTAHALRKGRAIQ